MNHFKRNNSNQLGELAETLSSYEMMCFYNPFFYKWKLKELHEDKQDLYYKSAGTTDFDSVIGIRNASMSVENIGEHLIGIGEQIDRLEREYREHRQILYKHTQDWQRCALDDLNRYFKAQMLGEELKLDSIEELKRTLYQVECAERKKRNKVAEKYQRLETERKARELQRKRDKLQRRWGVYDKRSTAGASSSL